MKSAITLISAAHAGVALASLLAVRGVSRVIDGMARQGGGIGDLSAGIAEAARWPMMAAWIAVGVSLLGALLLVSSRAATTAPAERPSRLAGGALAALGMTLGAVSVFAFRGLADFISQAVLPGGAESPGPAIASRLMTATAITTLCFAAAVVLAVMTFRSRAAMRVALFAVVISLGVSTALIVTLRGVTAEYQSVAMGGQLR